MIEKPKPEILNPKDAVVRITISSICSSDLENPGADDPCGQVDLTP